jgi:hypothetical protein
MKFGRYLLAVLAVSIVIGIGAWMKRQLDIDQCLDLGGRWDYPSAECQGQRSHLDLSMKPLAAWVPTTDGILPTQFGPI